MANANLGDTGPWILGIWALGLGNVEGVVFKFFSSPHGFNVFPMCIIAFGYRQ